MTLMTPPPLDVILSLSFVPFVSSIWFLPSLKRRCLKYLYVCFNWIIVCVLLLWFQLVDRSSFLYWFLALFVLILLSSDRRTMRCWSHTRTSSKVLSQWKVKVHFNFFFPFVSPENFVENEIKLKLWAKQQLFAFNLLKIILSNDYNLSFVINSICLIYIGTIKFHWKLKLEFCECWVAFFRLILI